MTDEGKWIACSERLPEDGVVVETKLAEPDRNVALLVRQGNLWFFADRTMYVYYTPTHWRRATRAKLAAEAERIRKVAKATTRLAAEIEQQEDTHA